MLPAHGWQGINVITFLGLGLLMLLLLLVQAVCKLLGYPGGELEGKNVALLMPQPFSGRHDKYLSNFSSTGVPKILNTSRHVVGLRKVIMVTPFFKAWLTEQRHFAAATLQLYCNSSPCLSSEKEQGTYDPQQMGAWVVPTGLHGSESSI